MRCSFYAEFVIDETEQPTDAHAVIMDLYGKYKSPFGYETGDNGIDSYGVDHSGFTLRDEI